MRALVLAFLLASTGAWGLAPAPTDAQAQLAHSRGSCGSWGPGTGLGPDGRGWIVSMLPGRHEFRVVGEGTAGVTYQHLMVMDFNAGQPYEFTMVGPGRLEWKVPGSDWGPVSKLFLYPKTVSRPPGF